MTPTVGKHALVIGASGVSGWGIINTLFTYPTPSTWTSITGTTNRPLSFEDAHLPTDPRLSLVSGIDLLKPPTELTQLLKEKIPDIGRITHVFFAAFIKHEYDAFEALCRDNVGIVKNCVGALNEVAPALEFFVMQTGGKHYGTDLGPEQVPSLLEQPYEESRPRIPPPSGDTVFYYGQCDAVAEACKDRQWTWCETRPDVIVGFVPSAGGSVGGQDAARGVGLYFSLYRKIHGEGAEVPFPGSEKAWMAWQTDSFQDTIGKISIWASLRSEECGKGEPFNTVDVPARWMDKWPVLASFFGLKGVPPVSAGRVWEVNTPDDWAVAHKAEQEELVKEYRLVGNAWESFNWWFLWAVTENLDYDRCYSMEKLQGMGFKEQMPIGEGWVIAFQRLRDARIIP